MNNSIVERVCSRSSTIYREGELPEYRGNPLIEALPPMYSETSRHWSY